jgi:hypothetical protein
MEIKKRRQHTNITKSYFEKNMDARLQPGVAVTPSHRHKRRRNQNDHCLYKKQTAPFPHNLGIWVRRYGDSFTFVPYSHHRTQKPLVEITCYGDKF